MQYSLTDLLIFFLIYGFLGFLLESIFRSAVTRKLTISRGFLTNYFCPLYGISAIVIIQIFTLCEITIESRFNALLAATLCSMAAVTVFEYVVGFTLDKFFNLKLWDYSQNPLNLNSYICLEFTLMWGAAAIFLTSFLHPIVEVAVMILPQPIEFISVCFIASILIVNASFNMRRYYHIHNVKV